MSVQLSESVYTPCYCEENCWNLVDNLRRSGDDVTTLFVVFVSNSIKKVPFWRHRASRDPDGFILWDYHVIVVQFPASEMGPAVIHDLDAELSTHSRAPFPFSDYTAQALRPSAVTAILAPEMSRLYRVVPATVFLNTFASDRSHMLIDGGACYAKPPPSYPCIVAASGETRTLPNFLEMPLPENAAQECPYDRRYKVNIDARYGYGTVVTEGAFLKFCSAEQAT